MEEKQLQNQTNQNQPQVEDEDKVQNQTQKKPKQPKAKTKKPARKLPFRMDIVLGILSLFIVFLLFLLINRFGSIAQEIKMLEEEKLRKTSTFAAQATQARITENKDKIDKLNTYFIGDDNLVDFVKELDVLKNEGVITQFNFASEKAERDRTTDYEALAFEVWFVGDKSRINYGLEKLLKLPYMIRTGLFELTKNPEGEEYTLKFGGFIYVKDAFGKN